MTPPPYPRQQKALLLHTPAFPHLSVHLEIQNSVVFVLLRPLIFLHSTSLSSHHHGPSSAISAMLLSFPSTRFRFRRPLSNSSPFPPPPRPPVPLAFLSRTSPLCSPNLNLKGGKAGAVTFNGPGIDAKELEDEKCELVMETCLTRTLPPAVTMEGGIESIKRALKELKLNPPPHGSGVLRFQVAVPPSPKALQWFCCQPESSGVFPRFFLSKGTEDPTFKSLDLNTTRGVFGIGVAIDFMQPSSRRTSEEQSLMRRYLSSDSIHVNMYGLMGVKYDKESSSITHEAGSVYFFIPKVELVEHDDATILAATLAWDSTLFCTIELAIESCESTIYQCSSYFFPMGSCIQSIFRKVNMVEDKGLQMVSATATLLDRRYDQGEPLELCGTTFYSQFCFRLSATVGISNNALDAASEVVYSLQEFPNINAVWASLIVEECSRLGLKYFCIAPGSRSSPLAIAASTHPLTTCVACYDERSLAFHAVGYGRGSRKPAIVITSSGTAVSNLLPAVVEASQDFVPLLLLTADRPPELQDAGANQAINQVNHFGSFVRFFFSLPPPTDDIPARMVITTVDSAVHWATTSPYGPVHINCPFREPLDDSPNRWDLGCLKGLDSWTTSAKPFTRYIAIQSSFSLSGNLPISLSEVIGIIEGAKRGLLLFGAIHTEDDMWAALLLAKHLNWPVVADILSDLRLRKLLASVPETEDNVLFIDHLDHALLSDSVRDWINFDVIIQIGSRITSKRISQMLEQCYPCSYVLVDDHPWRYDPSHFVTHRIQCSIVQFSDSLLKARFPCGSSKWCGYLQVLEKMVAWVVSFQILAENSLTEPHVAHVISGALCADSAIFLGNSMIIRDVDMYGSSCKSAHSIVDMVLNSELPCLGIRVAGNRGASGIDGLLSTAIGFATGCSKRVLCVMGDVSFLHDTNGLALLNQRLLRKPMTILVINNHGGAIFSLLPIADRTDPRLLNQYFYTSHNISIRELCKAHGVKHLQVKTKVELQDALLTSRNGKMDYVIEVDSCINANSAFHSMLRKSACQAADHALGNLFELSVPDSIPKGFFLSKIRKMEYSLYRIQLCAPPMTGFDDANELHREGYILSLSLEDGIVGYGEVAPLRIHKENMKDVDEQLRFLLHVIRGKKVCFSLSLLNGSFTSWIWKELGILESSIFPSVRCGLEMAILSAIAQRQGSSFLSTQQMRMREEDVYERTSSVKICALVDSDGSPATVACIASSLVEEGFTAIKLKVARQANPAQDAAIIQEVRKKVGAQIELRVDANRHWTYEEAVQFGSLVKDCDLQYIEEPVQDEDDIIRFCEESGLPVALDETMDSFRGNFLHMLGKYTHPGIVALVIKPSVVGGFEKAALIARWAQQLGKMAVVSATFESGLGLSSYILLSYFLDLQNADLCRAVNRELGPSVAHGLGTYQWLKQDVMTNSLGIRCDLCTGVMRASVADAIQVLQNFEVNQNIIHRTFSGEQVCRYSMTVQSQNISYIISVLEVGPKDTDNVVVFLHGFLGTGEDWLPIMKALSGSARCISFDFPGHGRSKIQNCGGGEDNHDLSLSIDIVADVFNKLIQKITPGQVTVVGYSMGGRIALHMVLRLSGKINAAVIISGSPGIKDSIARKIRRAKDDSRASFLVCYGLERFLDAWYTGELWRSLRSHPHFKEVVASHMLHDDVDSLSRALSDLSIGRQSPLWEDLKQCNLHLMLIVGEKDQKFQAIARQMYCEIEGVGNESRVHTRTFEVVEVPNCGHAVHLEDPLSVISVLSRFLTQLQEASRPG